MDSAIKNKLQSLLRLGLVSQSNVRRAMTLFQDPERYAKSPAYRTLMQEILVDVVDKIVNNRVLYTALRSSITKDKANQDTETSTKLGEGAETDRTNSLLRSGLVDKSEIAVARKALKSPQAALRMSSVKAYREMMVGLMDSMLRKITGNPALFNAFKRTMGKEIVEESFEYANSETISLCELDESAAETLAENKPTNTKLWSEAKTNARRVFTEYPSPCASGWAVKWYNEQGGDWASIAEGKSFFQFAKAADDSVITEFQTEESAAQARQAFVNHPAYKPPTRTGLPETPEQREASRAARIAALRASQTNKPVQEENAHTNKIDLQGEEMTTYLAVIHSAQIYRSRILSIVKNYKKKLKSGKYNPELAVKGFVYAVEDGLAERTKQTGVKMRLTGEQKLKVARELLDYYSDEIGEDMVKEGYEAMAEEERITEGKNLDRLKKLGIVGGMSLLGAGFGLAKHNTYSGGSKIFDVSAIPATIAGGIGGGLIGHLMAGQMVPGSNRNKNPKKLLKKKMVKEGYEKKLKRLQNASDRAGLGTARRTRLTKAAFDMENKSDAAKATRAGDEMGIHGTNDFRNAVHKFNRIASVKRKAIRSGNMAEETEEVVEKNTYGDFIDAYGKKIQNLKPESKLSKITKCIKKTIGEETEQLDERGEKKLGRVMGAKYDAYQRGDWKKHSRLTGVASKLQSRVDSARVRRAGGSPEVAAQDSPRDASGKITPQSKGNYRANRKALRKFTSNAQKRTSWAAKGRDGTLE